MMDPDHLLKLEPWLRSAIVGQDESIDTVVRAVQRAELGVQRAGQPRFVFLFLGPTGVGKTEMTLKLAEFLYGADFDSRLARFDMAEYQDGETAVKQLLGSNRNEQGLLGDAVDRLNARGGGILLFDEIEKAYRDVVTLFLAATDAARITMSNGETKNLEKMYMVFTSNLGSSRAINMERSNAEAVRKVILDSAKKFFSPELLARLTSRGGLCVFDKLSLEVQLRICENMLGKEIRDLCNQKKIEINRPGADVFNHLVDLGYDKRLGARPMRGAIEREIGDAYVRLLMSEHRSEQRLFLAKMTGEQNTFLVLKPASHGELSKAL